MTFIRKLLFSLRSGFRGAWKHRGMGVASVASTAMVLFILGFVLIAVITMNIMVSDVQNRVDEIELFLKADATDEQVTTAMEEVKSFEGVGEVVYRSKAEALELMKQSWGSNAFILEGMDQTNTLPASFVVTMKQLERTDAFVAWANELPVVNEITYYQDMVQRILQLSKYIQWGGLLAVLMLIGISVVLISNTIKLTLSSRKKEIQVMRDVGASRFLIIGQFIVEGVLFGVIAAGIAMGLTFGIYTYFFNNYSDAFYQFVSTALFSPETLHLDFGIIFLSLGVGIGAIGSLLSIRKDLKVQ